jgi:hypothetical protein
MPVPSHVKNWAERYRHKVPEGYCPWCCLPKEYDPGHTPPGYSRNQSFDTRSPEFRQFMKARVEHYRRAIDLLPEAELLKMPEPSKSPWRLSIYKLAYAKASSKPSKTAWDHLLGREPEFDLTPNEFQTQVQKLIDTARKGGLSVALIRTILGGMNI